MAKKYFVDKDSGDSEWTLDARDVVKRFIVVAESFVKEEEALHDGPVNLRELAYLIKYAVDGAVTEEILHRRLGGERGGIYDIKNMPALPAGGK